MVFDKLTKILILPLYYLIHHNIIFGLIQKYFLKVFKYKKFKFFLNIKDIPISNYSSFLFNTYEYNDRTLIERNLSRKNHCIVIGGGLGFVPCISYWYSRNKIIVFEINRKIINNLRKNLNYNKCKYKLFLKNLNFNKKEINKKFYLTKDFLSTSSKIKSKKFIKMKNLFYKNITDINQYNTLIIDAEGDEEYYINNLKYLKNIKHLFFELHYNLFTDAEILKLMKKLKKNRFKIKDKCFNSFYFAKS
ncbi:MAG: hypothetical protein CMC84_07910 [Flavobacteriaceae bacterium]|nr:hypothetical protein [Flavobacteriaceae bacterium]